MKSFNHLVLMAAIAFTSCGEVSNQKSMPEDSLQQEAVNTLRNIVKDQQEWIKVHAAEFLIWTGYAQGVKEAYEKELEQFGTKPQYRVGIWRVLTQVSDGDEAMTYRNNITKAFLDSNGNDRIHAIETMAKLKMSPLPQYALETTKALNSEVKSLSAYTHWAVAYTNADSLESAKKYFLARLTDTTEDLSVRRIAAYVLRNSGELALEQWQQLADFLSPVVVEKEVPVSFLNAALLAAPVAQRSSQAFLAFSQQFWKLRTARDKSTRMELAAGWAAIGGTQHLPVLQQWLRQEDPTGNPADDADISASAAYAIIKIANRLQNKP